MFELEDPGEIAETISDAAESLGDHWDAQVDKKSITTLAVVACHQVSDTNSGKPKKLKKTDRDIVNESNESVDSVLMLAIGFAAAHLANPCGVINKRMPPAELVRDFTTGCWILRAADRAMI